MFIMTAKLPKRKLLLALGIVGAAAAALLLFSGKSSHTPTPDGSSDARRVAYLASLGWEVEPQPTETLCVQLTQPLSEPYLSYNELQKLQGFDLSLLGDVELQRFTYTVTNHPCCDSCQADLYVLDGVIVAGDIVCTGENGFLSDLRFPKAQ